jgi:glycosyltransferase involved in cell wall biosynthesis
VSAGTSPPIFSNMPKISVILATYNGTAFIASAIESVISQTWRDLELIVVDDGSTDNVGEIIKSFSRRDPRVKYVRNGRNIGFQPSLNRGLREATGELIARIDDDDEWSGTDKLQRQVDFLDSHPDHVLVGTGYIVVDAQRKEISRRMPPKTDEEIRKNMLRTNCFAHPSVVFRKAAIAKVGPYLEGPAEDYDMWLKLGMVGKLANLDCYCLKYMIRPDSGSRLTNEAIIFQTIGLTKKYRHSYPNYWLGVLGEYYVLVKYFVLKPIPPGIRTAVTKFKYLLRSKT